MNLLPKIEIQYHCKVCGLKASCQVTARESPEIDVTKWMRKITNDVSADHQIKSFLCESNKVDLAIPIGGKDDKEHWIGKAVCPK